MHWDDSSQIPYASKGNQWIGYDDRRSVQKKMQFISENGLGGAMVWSIDGDDFGGHCGQGKYPLLRTVAQAPIAQGTNGAEDISKGNLVTEILHYIRLPFKIIKNIPSAFAKSEA